MRVFALTLYYLALISLNLCYVKFISRKIHNILIYLCKYTLKFRQFYKKLL